MSWFGSSTKPPQEKTTVNANTDNNNSYSLGSNAADFDGNKSNGKNFESELMEAKQKALVQTVIINLTEIAFASCITKPSTSLSQSEQQCIHSIANKYLDTGELYVQRMGTSLKLK